MSYNIFKQVSDDRYDIITKRYAKFQDSMNDPNSEPVKVFDPLRQKQIDELHLIREVSKDLQKKKEEDINKAAEAAAQMLKEVKEEEVEAKTEDSNNEEK